MHDIKKIWDDFIEKFPFTDDTLHTVVTCCKSANIDPNLFANNLFLLTGKRLSDKQQITEPTNSLVPILNYVPPGYSPFFIAAFPDAVWWFMNNFDTEKYRDYIHFKDLEEHQEKYFDENGKANSSFILLTFVAYFKSPDFLKFEASYNS
jgi:hypothetical protein